MSQHRENSAKMPSADRKRGRWRGWLFPWVSLIYLTLICGLPTACSVLFVQHSGRFHLLAAIVTPVLWSIIFLVFAGLLSIPHQFSIKAGKFRRDVCDRMYFHRRLYGLCWTTVFYNKPVYYLCLSLPFLKWATFRLFGYRGSMKFTVYPDTWLRDLPLLHFEDGVYVSNRATIGTNIVLSNGFLLVDGITLRSKALVGHLAMLAPGVEVHDGAEVGTGVAVGIKSKLGAGSFIGPCCAIEHGVRMGANVAIGPHTYIGSASVIPDGFRVREGSLIPPRTKVRPCVNGEEELCSVQVSD